MERIVLTYGYVPINNNQTEIYCGDSDTSETQELNFEIIDDDFLGIDIELKIKFKGPDLWHVDSELYSKLSETISNYFKIDVSPQLLYGAYGLIQDEPNEFSNNFEFIDSEGGVVSNFENELNGKLFLRSYFEEDEEIFEEKVIISINSFDK